MIEAVVEAAQWFKNGDHPNDSDRDITDFVEGLEVIKISRHERCLVNAEGDVVRYYRHPRGDGQQECRHCHTVLHNHGWLDTGGEGCLVCPGDWVITEESGRRYALPNDLFEAAFEAVGP